ncbi:MAG: hypothetical protein ACLTSM_05085 [Eubacterium sp.]
MAAATPKPVSKEDYKHLYGARKKAAKKAYIVQALEYNEEIEEPLSLFVRELDKFHSPKM